MYIFAHYYIHVCVPCKHAEDMAAGKEALVGGGVALSIAVSEESHKDCSTAG